MTRKEFAIVRRHYKFSVKNAFRRYMVSAYDDGAKGLMLDSERTFNLHSAYWRKLNEFARLVNVSPARAAEMLNLR